MSQIVRYLTHPQVRIEPERPVQLWSLSETGAARVAALARHPGLLHGTTRVITSAETKALETAKPLANALGASLEVRPDMHENDRTATGFLPPDEFEQVADQFFARPHESIRGWETAVHAQRRIVREVAACLSIHDGGDLLFVGHGGVGTLLFCALAGVVIERRYDQGPGGGGCWFQFDLQQHRPSHGWQFMEALHVAADIV